MLKQDILGFVYSKVKWFAINQNKKVNFRINPNSLRNENLRDAVEDLKRTNDIYDVTKQMSVVMGENYGISLPSFLIHGMDEHNFWPFITSGRWQSCTSIRVTRGELMQSIVQAYMELENEGMVLRYTTNLYEAMMMEKTRPCIRRRDGSSEQTKSDSDFSSTKENNPKEQYTQQMTKYSFTYYGTSLPQLQKILNESGLSDIRESDILRQNPGYVKRRASLPPNWPSLDQLCGHVNVDYLVMETVTGKITRTDASQVDLSGHRRKIVNRRFGTDGIQEMLANNELMGDGSHNRGYELLDPIHRRVMIERLQEGRLRNKHKMLLQKEYEESLKKCAGAYERWWISQGVKPVGGSRITFSPSQYSFFGESWVLASDNTVIDPKAPPRKNNVTLLPGIAMASPVFANKEEAPPPIVIMDINVVDSWKCDCMVCSGSLLKFNKYALAPTTDAVSHISQRRRASTKAKKPVKTRSPTKADGRSHSKSKLAFLDAHHGDKQSRRKSHVGEKSKEKKKENKKDNKKPKINPSLWWETVSTYTTPMWRDMEAFIGMTKNPVDKPIDKKAQKPNKAETDVMVPTKLRLNYSFDALKKRKIEKEKAKQKKIKSIKEMFQQQMKITDSKNDDDDISDGDSIDMDALRLHGIIYERKTGLGTPYTKLGLNTKEFNPQDGDIGTNRGRVKLPPLTIIHGDGDSPPQDVVSESMSDGTATLDNDEKCVEYIKSNFEKSYNGVPNVDYFRARVPKNFELLCLTGLAEYVVRFENVVTTRDYEHIESITVNRYPLCSYTERV